MVLDDDSGVEKEGISLSLNITILTQSFAVLHR